MCQQRKASILAQLSNYPWPDNQSTFRIAMKKLMIVDDSHMMRTTIEQFLCDYDLEIVGTAGNGKEAIRLLTETRPELVTLDITMPEMDGLECL